jgi:hypothetical protein
MVEKNGSDFMCITVEGADYHVRAPCNTTPTANSAKGKNAKWFSENKHYLAFGHTFTDMSDAKITGIMQYATGTSSYNHQFYGAVPVPDVIHSVTLNGQGTTFTWTVGKTDFIAWKNTGSNSGRYDSIPTNLSALLQTHEEFYKLISYFRDKDDEGILVSHKPGYFFRIRFPAFQTSLGP